jgi:truncated hemoglobin YjbI/tellurite resistance-related uncharacterized protein
MHFKECFWSDTMEGLDHRKIDQLVRRFYDRVRVDKELAPVFSVVGDWNEHLVRLSEFWTSVALMTGQYKGNPLAMHLVHADLFKPEMFDRWLVLWKETTDELLCPQEASMLQAKAARIATRFRTTMFPGSRASAPTFGIRPFKTSPEFTHENIPAVLLREHRLDKGTWGILRVHQGQILYFEDETGAGLSSGAGTAVLVRPDTPHRVEIVGPVSLTLEFYDQNPASLVH